MRTKFLGAALLASCTLTAPSASAGAPGPEMSTSRGGADVYWWSAKGLGSAFGLVPFLRYEVAAEIFLDAWLPIGANVDNSFDDKSRFGLGNPTLGVHYATTSGDATWYVGGRVSLPLVKIIDDNTQAIADLSAAAAMALYDAHFWTARFPLAGFGGVEYRASPSLFLRAEASPGIHIALRTGDKSQFMYQLRGEIEGRSDAGFGGGGALQFVHFPGEDGDAAQSAAEAFGSYDNGGFFARVGLLLALDEPAGFGFDKGKVATLHARVGGYL